jgi:hypothetical protein
MWTPGSGGSGGGGAVTSPLDVDNIRIEDNTISATNANGNVILDADGAGAVAATSRLNVAVASGAAIEAVVAGDGKVTVSATQVALASDVQIAWYNDPDIASGAADVGLERVSAGVVEVTNGSTGSGQLNVGANTKLTTTQVIAPAGSAGTPGLAGAGDLDTGWLFPGTDTIQGTFGASNAIQMAYNYIWLGRNDSAYTLGESMDAGLGWLAAGVLRAAAGLSGLGALSAGQWVLPRTADLALTSAHSGACITNTGAVGQVILTLPAATLTNGVGPTYLVCVRAAQNIRIVAAGTDVINLPLAASAAGGRIDSATARSTIRLFVSEAGFWDSISSGTWVAT